MRRVAVHRLFHPLAGETLPFQVVEVRSDGYVSGWFSLAGETERTEWLGGIIVLAPSLPMREGQETFAAYRERVTRRARSGEAGRSLRAYRIVPFDVSRMEFVAGSRILPL